MSNPQLYFIPGLGFDKRIFSNLKIKTREIHYIDWIEPLGNEILQDYAKRMSEQIEVSDNPKILIGHSFGGIIAQEISKIINIEKVIIISSIKSKDEMPLTFRILKKIPVYKILNKKLILKSFPIWAKPFGYKTEKGRKLFVDMISRCSTNYCRWSIDKIVNWEGNIKIKKLSHIHGSDDKTLFIKNIHNPIVVKDGSHFMVYSKADEVSKILNDLIVS